MNNTELRAIVSRLDTSGNLQWTTVLDIGSDWWDGVVTPTGDLLVVGHTMPYNFSTQGLTGLINSSGVFSWIQKSNLSGRERYTRVALNPSPDNSTYPFYVLGTQFESSGANTEEVILMTMDVNGALGWKKKYISFGNGQFVSDLEILPDGDLIMSGFFGGLTGVIFKADNTGGIYNSASVEFQFQFTDVSQIPSGGFYAVGFEGGNFGSRLFKLDQDFIPAWQIYIPNLQSVSGAWSVGNHVYVSASRSIGSYIQGVLLKFEDNGASPSYLWTKYLKANENGLFPGRSWFASPNQIVYADGRSRLHGLGSYDGFVSVSDLEFNTCLTQQVPDNFQIQDNLFFSPLPPEIEYIDAFPGTPVTSSSLNWSDAPACACCQDSTTFNNSLANAIQINTNPGDCEVTITIGNLSSCIHLEWIDWGDGSGKQIVS